MNTHANDTTLKDTTARPDDGLEAQVRRLALQAILDPAYFLVDVEIKGRQGSRTVNVYVDGDTGIGVDACAEISRELDFLLEAEDLIKGRYRLNVSSPGTARPLLMPRQYPQHVGRTLKVEFESVEAPTSITGRLSEVEPGGLVLETKRGQQRVAFAEVRNAVVQLPW